MKKYNHIMNLTFEVASNSYSPSSKEIKHGLKRRIHILEAEEKHTTDQGINNFDMGFKGNCNISDTLLFLSEQDYKSWLTRGKKQSNLTPEQAWSIVIAFMSYNSKKYPHILHPDQVWAVYCKADGFGKRTSKELEILNGGWDWSHIRDSSPEAIIEMAQTICSYPEAQNVLKTDPDLSVVYSISEQ